MEEAMTAVSGVISLFSLVLCVATLVAMWKIYAKMGRPGWVSLIPLYNGYVLFEELTGNGWNMLLLLIPFYNIYLAVKIQIDLAHAFGQSTVFGWGLALLMPIFQLILGFGSAVYRGSAYSTGQKAASRVPPTVNNTDDQRQIPPTFAEPMHTFLLQGAAGSYQGRYLQLQSDMSMGRASDNGISFPANTPGVSSHHCMLRVYNGTLYVEDLNSSYGTYINGARIQANQPVPVKPGDRISLGSARETFLIGRRS